MSPTPSTGPLGPFLALVRKDLRVFASDRRALILAFVVPVMLASMMASVSTGDGERGTIAVAVVDLDQSRLSQQVVDGLAADESLDVHPEGTADGARRRVRGGGVSVALVIPAGFGAGAAKGLFRSGTKPEITFLTDPTHAAEAGMVKGLLMQHAMKVVTRDAFSGPGGLAALDDAEKQATGSANMPVGLRLALTAMFRQIRQVRAESVAAGVDDPGKGGGDADDDFGLAAPFGVTEESVRAAGQTTTFVMSSHAFAGMAVQFILFGAIEAGVALLTERQKGLWRRVRSAPLSRWQVLGAKVVSQALVALATLTVLYAVGAAVFHVRVLGSWPAFALIAVGYALTSAAFGLVVATLGKTPQAARGVSVLAVLLMVMLGGAWMPSFLFPPWVQKVTLAIPTRWAVDGLDGATWRGLGFVSLAPGIVALFAFAAAFLGLAALRFRWEEE